MRHQIDTYIRAEESEKISHFDDLSVVQPIVERGRTRSMRCRGGIRQNKKAVAETIEDNVRRLISNELAICQLI